MYPMASSRGHQSALESAMRPVALALHWAVWASASGEPHRKYGNEPPCATLVALFSDRCFFLVIHTTSILTCLCLILTLRSLSS